MIWDAVSRFTLGMLSTSFLSSENQNGWKPGSVEVGGRNPVVWIESRISFLSCSHKVNFKNNVKVESKALHDHKFAPYPAIHTQAPMPLKSLSQWETCLTKNYRITSSNCWSFMCVTEQNFLSNEEKTPCKVKKVNLIFIFFWVCSSCIGSHFRKHRLGSSPKLFQHLIIINSAFLCECNFSRPHWLDRQTKLNQLGHTCHICYSKVEEL